MTNHCILSAVGPLSKDNLIQGQLCGEPKQLLQREATIAASLQHLTAEQVFLSSSVSTLHQLAAAHY